MTPFYQIELITYMTYVFVQETMNSPEKKKMYIRMTIPNYVNDLLKSELVAGNA